MPTLRTTSEAVAKLIEFDDDFEVDVAIETANAIVTEVCGAAGYTDTRLELIERWLAAHYYAIVVPQVKSRSIGPLSRSLALQVGYGFAGTTFGQQALRLDTAGGLARLDAAAQSGHLKRKVGIVNYGDTGTPPRPASYDCWPGS